MSIVVFCGPTISANQVRLELDALCLPPASQGDVYRAVLGRPAIIAVIDGYFRQLPSVWHKEILWAMKEGISVYGSASMGALRAAELAPFGMRGVGRIFEAFASGDLEDDDEVAVVHGPADCGYRPLSEAMVNIRYTLERAAAAGIVSSSTRATLVDIAKSAPYRLRSYELLNREAIEQGVCPSEIEALQAWLPEGRIDQKREDALLMLHTIKSRLAEHEEKEPILFTFHHTIAWENLIRTSSEAADDDTAIPEDLIGELAGGGLSSALAGALLRHLALAEAARRGWSVEDDTIRAEEIEFRTVRDLLDDNTFSLWLDSNNLSPEGFRGLIRDECLIELVRDRLWRTSVKQLPGYLRITGRYCALARRSADKQTVLKTAGLEEPTVEDTGVSLPALVAWYLDRGPVDQQTYSDLLRFAERDPDNFRRVALREYVYSRSGQTAT
ncbi:MAG: TfuA-like protein [Bryobacteraceae bacterium]